MATTKDFSELYKGIQTDISEALTDLHDLKIENQKGNQHLEQLKIQLSNIQNQFSDEIEFLEKNSEWEKFTIAFFGETNAGKSTIIEALRILHDEKNRRLLINKDEKSIRDLENDFSIRIQSLLDELENSYYQFSQISKNIRDEVSALKFSVQDQEQRVEKLSNKLEETKILHLESEAFIRRRRHPLRRLVKYGSISAVAFSLAVIITSQLPDLVSFVNEIFSNTITR